MEQLFGTLYTNPTESMKEAIVQNVTEIVNSTPRVTVNVVLDQYESGLIIDCDLTYLPQYARNAFDI